MRRSQWRWAAVAGLTVWAVLLAQLRFGGLAIPQGSVSGTPAAEVGVVACAAKLKEQSSVGYSECSSWTAGFELQCTADLSIVPRLLSHRRVFFVGNSIMREFMFDTEARLNNQASHGSRRQHQEICGKFDFNKFPSCTRHVNETDTRLVFTWMQVFKHTANTSLSAFYDGCSPRGLDECFETLFGPPENTVSDVLFLFIGHDDALRGILPPLHDRAYFLDALARRFRGLPILILPCGLGGTSDPAVTQRVTLINLDSVLVLSPKLRTVAWEKTCIGRYNLYLDHIHPGPLLMRQLSDRAFTVVTSALQGK